MSVSALLEALNNAGGFTSKKLATAARILYRMLKDEDCTTLLSFPAALIATGIRGVFVEFIKRGFFDCIITTCGTIDHDLARCFRPYYHGWFDANDRLLHRLRIHRIGNIFVPMESYGLVIEEKTKEFLEELWGDNISRIGTRRLLWELARRVIDKSEKREESIIWWAYKKDIPIIVPGPLDGSFGYNLWIAYQNQGISIDVFADESLLSDIIWESEKLGALIIGGGISKHHTIWWAQFKGGLQYAVYITTAVELDGSLSGAQTREAVSWKKISEKAQHVTVWAEATIVLPLIVAYLISVIEKRKRPPIVRRILAEKLT